jgi:hypothetical protein
MRVRFPPSPPNIKENIMPNKNGKGPKGRGPRDGHGGGKGKGTSKGSGPMTGGKKGIKK